MEPLYFLIAIMGCSDDASACSQVRVEPVRYASIAACQAAMPQALTRSTDLPFPLVTATCSGIGRQLAGRAGVSTRG